MASRRASDLVQYTVMLAKEPGYDDGGGSMESIDNIHKKYEDKK